MLENPQNATAKLDFKKTDIGNQGVTWCVLCYVG